MLGFFFTLEPRFFDPFLAFSCCVPSKGLTPIIDGNELGPVIAEVGKEGSAEAAAAAALVAATTTTAVLLVVTAVSPSSGKLGIARIM